MSLESSPGESAVRSSSSSADESHDIPTLSVREALERLGSGHSGLSAVEACLRLIILVLLIYTPIGHTFFGTSPLGPWIFLPSVGGAVAFLAAEEGRKALVRRRYVRC